MSPVDPEEPPTEEQATVPSGNVEGLLTYLKEARGFDFSGYKRTGLLRRIRHRMAQLGVSEYSAYIDRLEVDADEFTMLFNTILINVTGFLRDPEAWEVLRTDVIPTLLAERADTDPIRVWCAGCSSGQEAYSLAMVLEEALGTQAYLERVKIYATDIDEEALAQARQAAYDDTEIQGVPDDLKEKYFERRDRRWLFRQDLRRTVIFGRNDLVQDAPISRIDLLTCRNTLMYFNAETQSRILGRFHFALVPRGVLFLGKAEMLLSHGHIFEPVHLKRRIFRRLANATVPMTNPRSDQGSAAHRASIEGVERLRDRAFNLSPVAQVGVTPDDTVALINEQAVTTFGLSPRDVGRPLRDLELSYRPVELRTHVELARTERKPVRIRDVEWRRSNGVVQWFEIDVNPLLQDAELIGTSIVFHDVTAARTLQHELQRANRQLEATNEELQSTNEELETTNEELQSTVEELETTNEELQSTNEELETMNEELQSTNDELQVINEALRDRSAELNDVNDLVQSILTGIRAGVVVVDREMRVLAWNAGAQELWGVRSDEAEGQHLLNLDVGLPLADVHPLVRDAITDPAYLRESQLSAVNRRGRKIDVRLICSALISPSGEIRGAMLLMEPTDQP